MPSLEHYQQSSPEQFAGLLARSFNPESIKNYLRSQGTAYENYQDDPVGFGEEILGETYTDDVKVMMESVRDNVITVAKSANATGKTHGAARVAVWWYKCFPDSQVYTAAAPPESNLKNLLWGEIGTVIHRHPQLFSDDNPRSLHIERSPKSFLTGVTIPLSGTAQQREAKFSGKHAPYILFILDEGDAIPPEVYQGIESCMSGGHARLLVMFNPRAEMGPVYQMERDGRANVVSLSAFSHPNVVSGDDVIKGAVNRETTVRRVNEWCRPLTAEEKADSECFKLPDFLVGSVALNSRNIPYPALKPGWYKVMEAAFAYMVLGQYPAQAVNQLISREWVASARARWDTYVAKNGEVPPALVRPLMGIDVAEMGSDLNVACFRYGGYVPRLKDGVNTWGGVDTEVTGDRGAKLYKDLKAVRGNVDGTGVGAGVAPHMRRLGCSTTSVKVASSPTEKTELGDFGILRDQLWWAVREWLRVDPGAMLPPDEHLCEELTVPTYEIVKGKVKIMNKDTMRELLKRSPDKAEALMLTFYGGGFFEGVDLR